MKNINFAILFFAISSVMLMVYYGCKKDKDSNQIENSSGNIDMTINGVAWSPATLYASKSGEDMMVYGQSDDGKEFSIKLSSVSTGSFVIGEDNGGFFSDGQNNYRTGDLGTDTIVISAFENNMIEGEFDLLLIKQGSERDTSGYVQLKGSFHVEQFFNNPYGWDRGKVSFYKTAESCDVMVRINMFSKGGGSNETPIAGPSPYLTFNFTEIPECEYGGYNLDMAPLSSRSGFDFRILPEGDYSIQIVTPDDNMNWTKIIAEDVVKIEKQKCLLYEVKCDTGNSIKVVTKPVTEITENSAVTGGEISYDGAYPINITNRGVEYVAINPNYGESHTDDGSGLGEFISNLTDLHSITEYKVRAYCYDFERGHYYYGDWILFQTTGGGGGNESSFTINYDGTHSGNGNDFINYNNDGIVFSFPDINTHVSLGAYGGFILGSQSSVYECSNNMAPPIQIMVYDFTINSTLWSIYAKDCPYGSPGYWCSNATVTISLLTENHIVGSFGGTVHSSDGIPPLVNKPISGIFDIYYNW